MNHAEQKQKKRFVLTMRNQKGQVGIFVALIFQVIFVFFAMLVNVGLVVHHKINLQQSTDLAAYYGAMKQAEIMNVMAHVNYQVRQAWKLFTWRYRVLGTFGIEKRTDAGPATIQFPVTWTSSSVPGLADLKPKYNPLSKDFACGASYPNAAGVTVTDLPVMCLGHNGFQDWISSPSATYTENFCKFDCDQLDNIDVSAFKIQNITNVGTGGIFGNNLGKPINDAINKANNIVEKTCKSMGPITTQMLAIYYGAFIKDVQNRKRFIYMLAKNLGLPEAQMLDIQGESVFKGVTNTLKNNLTEANLTSMNDASITAFNGGKSFAGGTSFAEGMLRAIAIKRLMFFLVDCSYDGAAKHIKLKSFYNTAGDDLDANIVTNMLDANSGLDAGTVADIRAVFQLNGEDSNFLGYEKNPWIHIYYGVKATAEPKIPFLPIGKVKLNAISFAKPFGGTLGPWYYKTWPSSDDRSSGAWGARTDINLPKVNADDYPSAPKLKDAREYLPNYSLYVGDNYAHDGSNEPGNKAGLANTKVVALYHNLLANKYGDDNSSSEFSKDKIPETNRGSFRKPERWPRFGDWHHLIRPPEDTLYDPLAVDRADGTARNTFMRDIELSVVAPNQFDVTYYSIEPDFDKNFVRKLKIADIAGATGTAPAPLMPIDFGNQRGAKMSGVPEYFTVRQQLEVTQKLFKDQYVKIVQQNGNTDDAMRFGLDVIASRQSSVLTGWTFLNLTVDGYKDFPSPLTGGKNSMLFGTCDPSLNPWSDVYHAPYDEDANLPAVQGNCVSGGRTGYSVKLISSDILRSGRKFENMGGPGQDGEIKNPVPDDFLRF